MEGNMAAGNNTEKAQTLQPSNSNSPVETYLENPCLPSQASL